MYMYLLLNFNGHADVSHRVRVGVACFMTNCDYACGNGHLLPFYLLQRAAVIPSSFKEHAVVICAIASRIHVCRCVSDDRP
jgi:hypothetical protein